ncbi:MAG: hypothetical protein GY926_21500 [bacterium]|nr:hypothetical protein [bacterium]
MIAIYAVCIVLGVIGILGWLVLGLLSSSLDDKEHLEPEERFGSVGRSVIAGVAGFGLAGMSASFGGWNDGLAVVVALAGAGAAVVVAGYLGVEEDVGGDST